MPTLALQMNRGMNSIDEERVGELVPNKPLDVSGVEDLVEPLPLEVMSVQPPGVPAELPAGNQPVCNDDIIDLLEEEVLPPSAASGSQKPQKPVGLEQSCSPCCLQAWHRTEVKLQSLAMMLDTVQETVAKIYEHLAGAPAPVPAARYSVSSHASHGSSTRGIASHVSAITRLPRSSTGISGMSEDRFSASKNLQKHIQRSSLVSKASRKQRSSLQGTKRSADADDIDKSANLMSALRKAPILGHQQARAHLGMPQYVHGHFSHQRLSFSSARGSTRHDAAGTLLANPRLSFASMSGNQSKRFSERLDPILPSEVVEEVVALPAEVARSNTADFNERVDEAGTEEDLVVTEGDEGSQSCTSLSKRGISWSLGDAVKLTRSSTARLTIRSRSAHFSDGSSGGESEGNGCRAFWKKLADPQSKLRLCWDLALLVTLMFMSIVLPLQIAYLDDQRLPGALIFILGMSDVLRIADVAADIILPVIDGACSDLDTQSIIEMYAQSWLIVDVLSAWPSSFGPADGSLLCNVLRILNLLKCMKLAGVLLRVQEHFTSPILSYLKFFYPVFFLFHVLACTWRCVNDMESTTNHEHMEDKYVLDLYWVLMTITSVGYGDIVPQNLHSRAFSIFVMLMSSMFCGFIVSSTGSVMKWIFDQRVEARVIAAEKFMSNRSVPLQLRKNVVNYLRNDNKENSLSSPSKLLSSLSPTLQKQVSIELWRPAAKKFSLFSDAPEAFLVQLAQAFDWIEGLAGELLLEEGQVEEELVFVINGLVCCVNLTGLEDDNETEDIMFGPHSWFGERSLFGNFVRQYTAIIETRSELAVLTAMNFNRIVGLFPAVQEKHARLIEAIRAGTMRIEELAFEPDDCEMIVGATQSMLSAIVSKVFPRPRVNRRNLH